MVHYVRVADVRRSEIFKDVTNLYSDPSILLSKLTVRFKGESYLDFGGLTSDMFSTFWEAAFNCLFEGAVVKVPNVPSQSMAKAWKQFSTIGRIITCFTAALHGEDAVDDEAVIRSFLLYLTPYERDNLNTILSDSVTSDLTHECLLRIYERFGMTCCPAKSKQDLQRHIVGMAKVEFVYKPMQFLLWIRKTKECQEVSLSQKRERALLEVKRLYEALAPNKNRVLQKLVYYENLMPEQSKALHFLKSYLGSMDQELLEKFLRFVTAVTISPQQPITIEFNASFGLQRAPTISTCSST